jgi:2-iminobutanoate/2-iminopropanoate deaminase
MRVDDIVKMTIYFVGEVDVHARRAALANWLAGHEPCLTVLFVAALATPQLRVEVDAWASHNA